MTQFTLVLPIWIDPRSRVSDLDRFETLGMPSLERFLCADDVLELIVLTPPENLREVEARLLPGDRFPIRVVDDASLCGHTAGPPGWFRQQILKLAAADLVRTPWYLTLDADVICVRPVGSEFLLPGGRAIRQREPMRQHAEWWRASRRVLGDGIEFGPDDDVMGVTPALLHAPTVLDLTRRIAAADPGRPWTASLAARSELGWTEYSLYWTHVVDRSLAEKLYSDSRNVPYSASSVWESAQAEKLDAAELDRVFDPAAEHAFLVFQSRVGADLSMLARMLRPRLGLPAELSFGERGRAGRHALASKLTRAADRVRSALRDGRPSA